MNAARKERKRAARAAAIAQAEFETAEFRGFDVKRMRRAQEHVSTSGTGADKRKAHNAKVSDGTKVRYADGSTKNGESRIVKAKANAPDGTFIQFGARTKEGQLENKQRTPDDKRKMWTQGYTTMRRTTGRNSIAYAD